MARKPKEVRGIKFRPEWGTWEAQYNIGGSRVGMNFLDVESQQLVSDRFLLC
jgi:hypothetical protein